MKVLTNGEQVEMVQFQKNNQIQYTFVAGEFCPDPDSPHLRR